MKNETQNKLVVALLKCVEHQWLTADEYVEVFNYVARQQKIGQVAEVATADISKLEAAKNNRQVRRDRFVAKRASTPRKQVSKQQHQQIVDTFIAMDGSVHETCRVLNMHPTTVVNHVQYAGLIDVPSQYYVDRIITWRKNHNMYVNDPLPQIKDRPDGGYGLRP